MRGEGTHRFRFDPPQAIQSGVSPVPRQPPHPKTSRQFGRFRGIAPLACTPLGRTGLVAVQGSQSNGASSVSIALPQKPSSPPKQRPLYPPVASWENDTIGSDQLLPAAKEESSSLTPVPAPVASPTVVKLDPTSQPMSSSHQPVNRSELERFFADIGSRVLLPQTDLAHSSSRPPVDQRELERFFADVNYRVHLAETLQCQLDVRLATGFNVFDLIEPDENKLSDVLAGLLNPKGAHGQGDLFLRLHLRAAQPPP